MGGTEVGQIDLGLNVNQSSFNKQVKGLAQSAQAPIVNAFKPIGKLIGSVLAIGAITKFTKECLELGSDLTEVQNVVDTTFKTLNGSVNEFAANAMKTYGMSETLAKQYIGTLGAMSKSMGFSEQASYDMSAAVTALTGDVASFYNLSTDEAFDKLKSIWTGETETLKSIGVLLTQTNLDQYALNNGFGKTTASMTEQEKVMLRYQYTMSALSDAQGDFAKTSGSWANQTKVLSLQFNALKATLGQGFINLFTPIIQMVNALIGKLQILANQFKAFTELLTGNRGSGSSGVAAIAQDAANATEGLNGVAGAAKKAAKATGALGIDELNIMSDSSTDSSGSGGASGGGMDTGGMLTSTDAAVDTTTGKLMDLLGMAKDTAGKIFGFLKESFGDNVVGAFDKIKTAAAGLEQVFAKVFKDCIGFGQPLLDWFTGDFVTLIQTSIDSAGVVISGMISSFSMVFGSMWDLWSAEIGNFITIGLPILTQFATEFILTCTELFTAVKDIFDRVWMEGVQPALELIKQIWADCWTTIQDFWNTYGASIFENIREAVSRTGDLLQSAWTNIVKPVWDTLIKVLQDMWTNHIQPLCAEILSFIGELINGALEIYNQFIAPIVSWLVDVLSPVVTNVLSVIMKTTSNVINTIADAVRSTLKVLRGIIEFLTGVFTGNWKKAWLGVKDIVSGVFDGIWSIIKGAINGILGCINALISGVTSGINTVIRALNALSFDIPDWVPALGGKTFGFNLNELKAPQIPLLAQGGYVGANQPQLAVIGDNKREGEIVSPESKLLDMAVKAAELANGGGNLSTELLMTIVELLTRIITILESMDLDIELDGRSLLQSLKESRSKLGHQF